jgi:hypothetical protein
MNVKQLKLYYTFFLDQVERVQFKLIQNEWKKRELYVRMEASTMLWDS